MIPYLKQHLNPQVEQALNRTATLLESDGEWLQEQLDQIWPTVYRRSPVSLDKIVLQETPLSLQRQILRRFLIMHLPKAVTFEQVELLRQLINAPRRSKTATFPGGFWGEVSDDTIMLRNAMNELPP